jgi:hypothetical protein
MDTVFDRFGNRHAVKDLQVPASDKVIGGGNLISSVTSCTVGMFAVYYANGSGMENPTNPLHITRRQTVCEVLSNLSGLLGYNSSYPNSALVKILVDDITPYTAPATPSASGVLGLATGYYVVPNYPASANPGITENLIQKTIKSKTDAWTNILSPVLPLNGNGFYHGVMAFNFSNPGITWNPDISLLATGSQFDLYTVVLHEITHALGFASLISASGKSSFGAANNYYSTYDTYLHRLPSNNLLVPVLTATGSCNVLYGASVTVSPSLLSPGCPASYTPDATGCASAIRYKSTLIPNMPVYTPACYEGGSSLSHFEDMCYPTNNPANNNQYFTMSNASGPAANKRHLQAEEKSVLCDLGYAVLNTYTSNAVAASYTYTGGQCNNSPIFGINDGLVGTGFIYTSTGGPVSISITGSAGVIANDYQGSNPVTTVSCVESIYNNGVATVSGSNIIFTPANTQGGIFVIRYIPTNAIGQKGNVTYIFGFVFPSYCGTVSPCDMVQNGGFENNSGCGPMPIGSTTLASCWLVSSLTPDMFVRGCTTSTMQANLGTDTFSSNPVFDSHNGNPNNTVVGFAGVSGPTELYYSESLCNYLGAPLLNNKAYTLSFWAYQFVGDKHDPLASPGPQSFNSNSISVVLSFAVDSVYIPSSTGLNYPYTPLSVIKSITLANVFNSWVHYSVTFTTSLSKVGKWLYVGPDKTLTFNNILNLAGIGNVSGLLFYTLIDDVSLKPESLAGKLNIPNEICLGQGIFDLQQYANPPGGTFSGVGVTSSVVTSPNGTLTQYNFNSSQNMAAGIYNISYTYTDNLLCSQVVIRQVKIGNVHNGIQTAFSSASSCVNSGTLSIISPTPSLSYTWQPGNFVGSQYPITPNTSVNYTVYGISSTTCAHVGKISVTPNVASAQLSVSPQPGCIGDQIAVGATGNFTSVLWQPGNFTTAVISVTLSTSKSYSVIATSAAGCTVLAAIVASVNSKPVVGISIDSRPICTGKPSTLTATGANSYTWNNNVQGPINIVNPGTPTIYTVTGITNSCSSSATAMVGSNSIGVSATQSTVCAGEQVTLSAQQGANTYKWMPANMYASVVTVTPMVSTSYVVYATYFSFQNVCTVTNTVQITVNPCTEIAALPAAVDNFQIYPNPNGGTFTIESPGREPTEISIYNESGILVRTIQLDESNHRKYISSDLSAGFYIVAANSHYAKLVILDAER